MELHLNYGTWLCKMGGNSTKASSPVSFPVCPVLDGNSLKTGTISESFSSSSSGWKYHENVLLVFQAALEVLKERLMFHILTISSLLTSSLSRILLLRSSSWLVSLITSIPSLSPSSPLPSYLINHGDANLCL